MEGVLSIVLMVAAIASLVFAVVMAVRSGRGGEWTRKRWSGDSRSCAG